MMKVAVIHDDDVKTRSIQHCTKVCNPIELKKNQKKVSII